MAVCHHLWESDSAMREAMARTGRVGAGDQEAQRGGYAWPPVVAAGLRDLCETRTDDWK